MDHRINLLSKVLLVFRKYRLMVKRHLYIIHWDYIAFCYCKRVIPWFKYFAFFLVNWYEVVISFCLRKQLGRQGSLLSLLSVYLYVCPSVCLPDQLSLYGCMYSAVKSFSLHLFILALLSRKLIVLPCLIHSRVFLGPARYKQGSSCRVWTHILSAILESQAKCANHNTICPATLLCHTVESFDKLFL